MKVKTVDYKSKNAPAEFVESLKNTGFGVLKNHPISKNLIPDVYAEWEAFFKNEEKHKYTFNPKDQTGYFPYKSENAKGVKQKDLKEFYHFYYGRTELPKFLSSKSVQLCEELIKMGVELLGWVEEALPQDLKKRLSMPFGDMVKGSDQTLLRILHYPPIEGEIEAGAVRAAAHEDINLITLLAAATEPGLEVLDVQGKWHPVMCDIGTIVVNTGDMVQLATRGYFKSTTHRVVNPSGESAKRSRYSMPLFLHPRPDVPLSPEHTAGSYLKERLKEIGLM